MFINYNLSALKPNRGFPQNQTEPAVFFKTETELKFTNPFRTWDYSNPITRWCDNVL